MARNSANTVFEVYDPTISEKGSDICGLWESRPASAIRLDRLAFSNSAASLNQDAFIWRTKLPENNLLAANSLIDGEAKVENYVSSLQTVSIYIDQMAAGQTQAWEAVNSITSLELRQLMLKSQLDAGVVFGPISDISASWSRISPEFLDFIARIKRLLSHYASIETFIRNKLIARTLVTWVGDSHTLWQTSRSDAEPLLHQRNVSLSLRSKNAWVQTFVVVAQGTLKLSLLLASGATILALPAMWRLVQDMVAQAETLRTILSEKT